MMTWNLYNFWKAHFKLKFHLMYLKGTVECGLKYDTNQKINLEGYVDSYWAGSAIDRKSTSRCCFSMRSSVISWFSRKESYMALSTAEEKYVATCLVICEALCFFWKLLFDLIDLTCIFVWCREEQWSSILWSRSRSLERGSSSIADETSFLSIKSWKSL